MIQLSGFYSKKAQGVFYPKVFIDINKGKMLFKVVETISVSLFSNKKKMPMQTTRFYNCKNMDVTSPVFLFDQIENVIKMV